MELLEVSLVSVPSNASAVLAARLGGKGDRPLYVDGAPLTPARLAAILRDKRSERTGEQAFVVTRASVVAAVKDALPAIAAEVPRLVARHVLALAGRPAPYEPGPNDPPLVRAACAVLRERS